MSHKIIHSLLIMANRLKIQLLLCFCLLFMGNHLKAQQEIMYSQYMYNMININPAYSGNRVGDNITSLYRKQWLSVKGAPTTYSLSWDRGSEEIGNGLHQESTPIGYGVQIYKDQLGIETSQGIQAFYSYHLRFYDSYLSLGISGGAMNYRAAYSQVSTTKIDPVFQEDISTIVPTAGIGALYATMQWYVGLSVPALLHTKITKDGQTITTGSNSHYFLTGGYIFDVSEDLKLKPSIMLRAIKGESLQYDLNLNAWIQSTVALGVSYHANDAVIGMFQIRIKPEITLGYAYDYLISSLKTFSRGSHELILNFQFNSPKNPQIVSPRYY